MEFMVIFLKVFAAVILAAVSFVSPIILFITADERELSDGVRLSCNYAAIFILLVDITAILSAATYFS